LECEIVANNVDPCISSCGYNEETDSKKCVDENQRNSVWIGVIICLIGSTTLNIGLNVQKYAFTKHQEELDRYNQETETIPDDDNNSTRNSIKSSRRSTLYKKLEKFMFWKQIIVSPVSVDTRNR
jgi:hypothetical protein